MPNVNSRSLWNFQCAARPVASRTGTVGLGADAALGVPIVSADLRAAAAAGGGLHSAGEAALQSPCRRD